MWVGTAHVDGIGGEGQDVFIGMRRWLPIFVLMGIIGVGPGALGWVHQLQMKQIALPRATLPTAKGAAPLKNTPSQPIHNPATCMVCLTLHAPMAADPTGVSVQAPHQTAQIAWPVPTPQIERPFLFVAHCRGPPIA